MFYWSIACLLFWCVAWLPYCRFYEAFMDMLLLSFVPVQKLKGRLDRKGTTPQKGAGQENQDCKNISKSCVSTSERLPKAIFIFLLS